MARKVVIMVGSIRADSINLKLTKALLKLAAPELRFEFAKLDDLPAFNPRRRRNERLHAEITAELHGHLRELGRENS